MSKLALPLAGGPRFLRLHSAACFERLPSDSPDINAYGEIPRTAKLPCVVLDFLPLDPTNPSTLAALLTGARVPGEIRYKARECPMASVVAGNPMVVEVDLDIVVARLNAMFDKRLQLVGNNCRDFVDAVFECCQEP